MTLSGYVGSYAQKYAAERAAVASGILAPAAMTAQLLGALLHLRNPPARLGCARP